MPESAEGSAQVLEEDSASKKSTACFPESSSRDSEEIDGEGLGVYLIKTNKPAVRYFRFINLKLSR